MWQALMCEKLGGEQKTSPDEFYLTHPCAAQACVISVIGPTQKVETEREHD